MKGLWKKLTDWFYSYGEKHAGMKSIRGSFEGKVPEKLKKHGTERKN